MIEEALRSMILASAAGAELAGGVWLDERPALAVSQGARQPPSAVVERISTGIFPSHNRGAQMREARFQIDVYVFDAEPVQTSAFSDGATFGDGSTFVDTWPHFAGAPETRAARIARGIEAALNGYSGVPITGVRIFSCWLDRRGSTRAGEGKSKSARASADYLILFSEAAIPAALA